LGRGFVTVIRKVYVEIMTFEFKKVSDGIDASECVEGVGLGDVPMAALKVQGPKVSMCTSFQGTATACRGDRRPHCQEVFLEILHVAQEGVTALMVAVSFLW